MVRVVIPYQPRPHQAKAHDTMIRWNVLVWHRRAWKTVFALNELQGKKWGKWALNIKDGRFAYIAPTYKQAKNVARDLLKQYSRMIPWIVYNESELTATYPNWSKIKLYWADNPDSLRWIGLDWVVFDEYAQQPSNIFGEVIRPALADKEWRWIWIGTPKWYNAFYELRNKARQLDERQAQLLTVEDTKCIPKKELREAEAIMTPEQYNQEFYCSRDASVKWAYYWKEIAECAERLTAWLYDPYLPVSTFRDLWIDDYTSIIFVQFHHKEVRILDHYEAHWYWLDHYINVIREKKYNYWTHYLPHDVNVRELTTWSTRLDFFVKWLWNNCNIVKKIPIEDWINATRVMLKNTRFEQEKTVDLRNALSQYRQEFDQKKWVFKERPLHDRTSHSADAMRYCWVMYQEITKPKHNDKAVYVDVTSKYF